MTDLALQWMSFRQSGKLADLDGGLTGGMASRSLVDNLVTLGHVEWVGEGRWRIAPPILAGLPREGGFAAVLCGARTPALLQSLERASTVAGAQMNSVQQGVLPAAIRIAAPSQNVLAEAAGKAGVPFQADAGLRMLACVPSIRDWPRTPCPMVEGRVDAVRRFSKSRMSWVTSTLAEATNADRGFFRIKRDWDWVSLIKNGASQAALIDDRAGRFTVAAKCKVVRWVREGGILTLPTQLYPPNLIARGLVLCSGHAPSFAREARQITFIGVQQEHLRLFLALTGLRLQ